MKSLAQDLRLHAGMCPSGEAVEQQVRLKNNHRGANEEDLEALVLPTLMGFEPRRRNPAKRSGVGGRQVFSNSLRSWRPFGCAQGRLRGEDFPYRTQTSRRSWNFVSWWLTIAQPPVQPPASIRRQVDLQSLVQDEFPRRERRAHALVERVGARPFGAAALMRLHFAQEQFGFEPRPNFAGVVARRVGCAAGVVVKVPGPRVEPAARFALSVGEIPVHASGLYALQR